MGGGLEFGTEIFVGVRIATLDVVQSSGWAGVGIDADIELGDGADIVD